MEVSRIRALRGPNVWCRQTAIEAIVSCTDSECAIDDLDAFETRLRVRFPDIDIQRPTGAAADHSLAHVLAGAALSLQAVAGCPVAFRRTAATQTPGEYQVVVEYAEESVGRLAFDLACSLCHAALLDQPFDLADAVAQLKALYEDVRLGPSTGSIVQAAVRRGIPYRRLTDGSLVQFGWGRRQRRIQAAETDASSAIGEAIAQDKALTKSLLAAAGVSVPQGRVVADADDAWRAAQEIGGPVVVKPQDGNQGKGVACNVQGREQVLAAYAVACEHGSSVIVERYFPGHDFRLLVVGDRLVAAARRDPPQVVGDGVLNISQLVDLINQDPLRGEGHGTSLTRIQLDETALNTLAGQGYRADSVPAQGVCVVLRNNANLSTGGTATDVTEQVHPKLAASAVMAASMVGLDVCGIDLVARDVYQPLTPETGCIVEVNAAPGLRMHLTPSYGTGRDVGAAMVDTLYGPGDDGRIPVVAVTGTNGKTTTVRLLAHLCARPGVCVGMTNSDGVYVGARRIDTGDCSGPRSARNVLLHPDVDMAVFETARGGILREGLGFDRCDVAVVTNIGIGDHLGLNYIRTVEDLAVVKRVIVENVSPSGMAVLNAQDPVVAGMAASCPGQVTYFARDARHPLIETHRAQGGRVVFVDQGDLVFFQGGTETRIQLSAVPLTRGGTLPFQVENAMAAAAAAWALGVDWVQIQAGLASFVNDAATVPGRFNVFDYRGAMVIADYGHNPDAMLALVDAVEALPAKRRTVVISGAGDRRDQDIRRQTEILGDVFDTVILYQDQCQRGREDGEVLALLRQGLSGARRVSRLEEIHGEFLAIDTALGVLEPGDLCLVLIDQVEEALAHIGLRTQAQAAA
ncbi:cyanophycin synthetase [uncultured Castellaniella sp.]|uniref:cyanophycin synthetase n=1 Tax=uncultured Castellaniella sp. TaxID=647907 RepID=UPI0026016A99|nr:cyanophycin synthetase [uncultured Castellaniella sp.]